MAYHLSNVRYRTVPSGETHNETRAPDLQFIASATVFHSICKRRWTAVEGQEFAQVNDTHFMIWCPHCGRLDEEPFTIGT